MYTYSAEPARTRSQAPDPESYSAEAKRRTRRAGGGALAL